MAPDQLEGLMDLLGCSRESEDQLSNAPSLNPASLTGGSNSQAPPNMKVAVRKTKKNDEKAIWQPEEFKAASGVIVKEEADDRIQPKYDILYRQRVGASDAFLNLLETDPSSDQCQDLLVKIWLPGTALKDISLDVLDDRLLLQAPKHRLNLALPHKVKKDSGNAKWDKPQGLLSVVIPVAVKIKYYSKVDDILTEK
eukprot:CAMPEP_0194499756 /NCGR_PEP_ID=MMETSP0253-20130528/15958_1 /TAXON_ID=2966 /ORGANISM="Noctiluca scintillans" /LENGTH=196 /DNA_ID=CAMNT_0039341533 /DNA_START=102 /DNA_END=692 /DNA_ORIENTATION=-